MVIYLYTKKRGIYWIKTTIQKQLRLIIYVHLVLMDLCLYIVAITNQVGHIDFLSKKIIG